MLSSGDPVFPGWYFDGESAAKRQVNVFMAADRLTIRDAAGVLMADWPLSDVGPAGSSSDDGPVRLRCGFTSDARLRVDVADFRERLAIAAPALSAQLRRRWPNWRQVAYATGAAGILIFGIVYAVPKISVPLARAVPLEWELGLGESVLQRLTVKTPICDTADGAGALDRIAERLTKNLDTTISLKVRVVNSNMRNAAALPGGHIIIMRGLLESLEGADELVGIIAHEIGHVVERHALAGMIRIAGLWLLLTAVTGGSDIADQLVPVSGSLIAYSYSRDDERAADRFALALLDKAEVSPRGLENFFSRMAYLEKRVGVAQAARYTALLSTHPLTDERLRTIRAAHVTKYRGVLNWEQWMALKRICQ